MTACVIYSRFSPRRNAAESESCETQERLCLEHAEAQGWKVRSAHRDEGVSGNTVHRQGLEEALAALRKGDVLLVYRRDRLARDVFLSELIRRQVRSAGATICAVDGEAVNGLDQSPEAVFVRQVLDAVAELERKLIGARTRTAMRAQQRAGKRVGRYAPYGFSFDPEDKSRLVPHEGEQRAIKRVIELANMRLSPWKIARQLDQELPDACRGKKWSATTIQKILDR